MPFVRSCVSPWAVAPLLLSVASTTFNPLTTNGSQAGGTAAPAAPAAQASPQTRPEAKLSAPRVASTTTYRLRQTVRLRGVPAGAANARLWVPVPSDTAWQRVTDLRVIDAPAGWTLERQDDPRGQMIYVNVEKPKGPIAVTVECTVVRDAVTASLAPLGMNDLDRALFRDELATNAPLMSATDEVVALARKACAGETDVRRKAARLLDAVATMADHYSKDPSKPHCGRGAAEDCLANGGGCCTDLHALFIAMARAEGIPARLQFGYRLTTANEGKTDADPGYRCWVEYFLPGSGWVPTDIVVADSGEASARESAWGKLDDRRVWLWEGRGFTLQPAQAGGPIQTMIVGYAEVDGKPVDPLPAADGTPSNLERRITFSVIDHAKPEVRAAANP